MIKFLFFALIALFLAAGSGCTFATVISLEENEQARGGFDALGYVDGVWDSQVVPTVTEQAISLTELLPQIEANQNAAIEAHGRRSGTGNYSFLTSVTATGRELNTESQAGLLLLDVPDYSGPAQIALAVGPVIRGDAVRDGVGFIQFNDFVNQMDFAAVSRALKERVTQDVLAPLDLESLVGKQLRIVGAFTLTNPADIVIAPVQIEVLQ
jgi:predicted lipoprotein